jgi:hypothetical protein
MSRKKKSPLREGLPSKVYFLAYPTPIGVRRIAERIYGRPKKSSNLPTSHLYEITGKTYSNHFKKVNGKVQSKSKFLLEEIAKVLDQKEISLNNYEKKQLAFFLDSPEFREFINLIKPDLTGNLNATTTLTRALALLAAIQLIDWSLFGEKLMKVPRPFERKFSKFLREKIKELDEKLYYEYISKITEDELEKAKATLKNKLQLSLLSKLVGLDEMATLVLFIFKSFLATYLASLDFRKVK